MVALSCKANAEEAISRLCQLYSGDGKDRIFACFSLPSRALAEMRRRDSDGFCDYPEAEERLAFWQEHLAERAPLEDDSIPSLYLSEFDQGLFGGMLGGDVRFIRDTGNGFVSSMVPPLLSDWSELESLAVAPGNPWFERYLSRLALYSQAASGRFGISHLIVVDSLNFAFELVGATNAYLGLIECPDLVCRAIELAFHVNVKVLDAFFATVLPLAGGTCSLTAEWLPGRVVNESVDPFHMTSVAYFEEWGREPLQRMFDRYDGGVLHLHGNGRHLLEAVRSLRGLKAVALGDDKGYPPASDVLGELRRRAGDVPLSVSIGYEPFAERLRRHDLPGGVLYRVSGASTTAEANHCMDAVRTYRL